MSLPSVCLCLNQLCEFLWLVPLLVFHPFFQSLSLSPSCSFVFPRSLSSAFPLFVCHVPQFPILWKSGVSMFGMLPLWHHVYSCQCVPRVFSLPRCFYVSFSLGPVLRSPLFLCVSLCASLCPLFIYISGLVCISFGLAIKLCLSYFCLRESAFGTFPACCTAKFMTQRPKTLQTLHTSTQRNFQVHIGL